MSDYVIVTDSASDLSSELIKAAGIKVIPLSFTMDGNSYYDYPDKSEMAVKDFYDMLRKGHTATTNAININEYIEMLTPILSDGMDVLVVVFSSGLSSTYSSAVVACETLRETFPERKILVSDSLSASMGQALLVWLAAKEKEAGKTIEEVHEWVEGNKLNICHQFTVDDLDFLKRGGRISGVTAALGGALNIKPVLHVDNTGHLVNIRKVRGRKASLKALVEKMEATAIKNIRHTVFISHGDCLAEAEEIRDMVMESFPDASITIGNIGPVIGAHTGPNVAALFYLGESR